MVELALVLILLVSLLVGTVSAAIAYGRSNSIQNAAREASRFGATLPGAADGDWLNQVRGVARAAALGDLEAAVPGSYICVAYIDEMDTPIKLDNDSMTTAAADCFNDGRSGEARVQVEVARDTDFQVVVFSTTVNLTAEAAARYER